MSAFTLDTSGFVEGPPAGVRTKRIYWPDLHLLAQGYVEAALSASAEALALEYAEDGHEPNGEERGKFVPTFSSLAHETLAAILKDCEAWIDERHQINPHWIARADVGTEFWRDRQAGVYNNFPPRTLYIGDDGLIYLREAA